MRLLSCFEVDLEQYIGKRITPNSKNRIYGAMVNRLYNENMVTYYDLYEISKREVKEAKEIKWREILIEIIWDHMGEILGENAERNKHIYQQNVKKRSRDELEILAMKLEKGELGIKYGAGLIRYFKLKRGSGGEVAIAELFKKYEIPVEWINDISPQICKMIKNNRSLGVISMAALKTANNMKQEEIGNNICKQWIYTDLMRKGYNLPMILEYNGRIIKKVENREGNIEHLEQAFLNEYEPITQKPADNIYEIIWNKERIWPHNITVPTFTGGGGKKIRFKSTDNLNHTIYLANKDWSINKSLKEETSKPKINGVVECQLEAGTYYLTCTNCSNMKLILNITSMIRSTPIGFTCGTTGGLRTVNWNENATWPQYITMAQNTQVTIKSNDDIPHTIEYKEEEGKAEIFCREAINFSINRIFNKSGTYRLIDVKNPNMVLVISVVGNNINNPIKKINLEIKDKNKIGNILPKLPENFEYNEEFLTEINKWIQIDSGLKRLNLCYINNRNKIIKYGTDKLAHNLYQSKTINDIVTLPGNEEALMLLKDEIGDNLVKKAFTIVTNETDHLDVKRLSHWYNSNRSYALLALSHCLQEDGSINLSKLSKLM